MSNTNLNGKKISDSLAEQVHVLTMETLNGNQRLSGPKLLYWIDEVATIVARRHAGSDVTTARLSRIQSSLRGISSTPEEQV